MKMAEYKPSAAEIKQIREKTLAGFQDCQKALVETNGDITAAEELIRKKGLQVAAKKAHRHASEGLVHACISDDKTSGSLVEVNIETDFAAKNDKFKDLCVLLGEHVHESGPDEVTDGPQIYDVKIASNGNKTVKTAIDETIGTIGENMGLKRAVRFAAEAPGVVHAYIHPPGKVGVLIEVGFESDGDKDKADELAHELALQIAFADPSCLAIEDIPEAVLAKEREIAEGKAREQGKPDHLVPKIAEGMLRKFYKEECLLEQEYAKDTSVFVKDFIKKSGIAGATVRRFVRFALK
jgi:elongation factor Ts